MPTKTTKPKITVDDIIIDYDDSETEILRDVINQLFERISELEKKIETLENAYSTDLVKKKLANKKYYQKLKDAYKEKKKQEEIEIE